MASASSRSPQNAPDSPLADGHDEFADRRLFRQREHVDRLDLLVERVLELLGDVHRADVTDDLRTHLGVLERQRQLNFVVQLDPRPGEATPASRRNRASLPRSYPPSVRFDQGLQ